MQIWKVNYVSDDEDIDAYFGSEEMADRFVCSSILKSILSLDEGEEDLRGYVNQFLIKAEGGYFKEAWTYWINDTPTNDTVDLDEVGESASYDVPVFRYTAKAREWISQGEKGLTYALDSEDDPEDVD